MATQFNGEGNIGSAPDWRQVAGSKTDRCVLRLNVYFDNPVPVGDEIVDRGGFWRDVEWWHRDAEHLASLFQVGMRVMVRGNEILDTWDDGQKSAFKVQASRVAILPMRLATVMMKPKE